MTNDTVSLVPGQPGGAGQESSTQRCHELARTERGWERCHRDEHDEGDRHHVRDRSWLTTMSSPVLETAMSFTLVSGVAA